MSGPRRIDLGAIGAEGAAQLAEAVRGAHLVCFPTDTVYGVGGEARPDVVAALVAAKGRDPGRPLQAVFPRIELLLAALQPAPRLGAALRALLPGPVTLVVPHPAGVACPAPVLNERGEATLGVRVPRWPAAAAAMATLPRPLVASSANPSGAPPAHRLDDVTPALRAACDLLLDAGPIGGTASTVVDLCGFAAGGAWRILREGALATSEVAAALAAVAE